MNSKRMTIKDSSLTFILGFILSQLSVVIVTIATMVFFKFFKGETETFNGFLNSGVGYLICSLAMYSVLLILFFVFNKNKDNHIFKKPKLSKMFIIIGLAVVSFFMLYPIVTCIDSLLIKMNVVINTIAYQLNSTNYFLSIISLVLAPAICEELIFRGIIFKGLKPHGKVLAISISALMFSIFHMAISQTVYPLLMGLFFAVIMFYEDNIYYSITAHMVNNFLSLTLSYFNISLIFNHWTYILLAVVLFVAFLGIILFLVIKNNKSHEKLGLSKEHKLYLFSSLGIMMLFWILVNLI